MVSFLAGAYNMGGSPAPTVAKIKNMVYMNQTGEQKISSREEYLGEAYSYYYLISVAVLMFLSQP